MCSYNSVWYFWANPYKHSTNTVVGTLEICSCSNMALSTGSVVIIFVISMKGKEVKKLDEFKDSLIQEMLKKIKVFIKHIHYTHHICSAHNIQLITNRVEVE